MTLQRLRARLASWWYTLWRSRQLDVAMHEEMRFHIEMEAERLIRDRKLDPGEARRLAHAAFGGVEKYKEAGRDVRGWRWIDALSLDVRLGLRMLLKHRGLTLVGGFAMAVTIAIGAAFFEIVSEMLNPVLPVDQGDRVVALRYATTTPGNPERRILHDFVAWRQELRSIEQLGAFRDVRHTLGTGTASSVTILVAEITASGFAVTRTPPLIGRYLLDTDEQEGTPPVIVIGHNVWRSRFAGDRQIVGRVITLSDAPFTIVGVMPEGFRFPVDHQFWIPLRANALQYERLQGPALNIFGRLAPGITMREAQAELTTIGDRTAAAYPDTHAKLRPVVLPYTRESSGITDPFRLWMFRVAVLLVGALTIVVAVNLAILVYARTVTRLGEIAVRTALGASRRRILAQLFIESFALSVLGAVAGLTLAALALDRLQQFRLQGFLLSGASNPYWIDLEVSIATVIYTLGLAIAAALIMGVLPGLKATGRRVIPNLRELDRRAGTRLGPLWTTLVVAQVAVAVMVLPMAVHTTWQVVRMGVAAPAIAAERFFVGGVAVGDERSATDPDRLRRLQLELTSRLETEAGVSAVTFSSGVPGFGEAGRTLEFDAGQSVKDASGSFDVGTLDVGLDLFDVYGTAIVAGRAFSTADLGSTNTVIVNQTFVEQYVSGSPLGVRFRYVAPHERPGTRPETTYQIVGVVRDFPGFLPEPGSDDAPAVYHPAAPGEARPLALSIRFTSDAPADFADRFRALVSEIDPAMQVRRAAPLTDIYDQMRALWVSVAWGISLMTMSVLLLSAAGIYALMSFTVAQRAREIAIRTALGAAPHSLLVNIFRRATFQLAAGVFVGAALPVAILQDADFSIGGLISFVFLVAAIMLAFGLLAAVGPARRGLRIDASEALKADS